MEGNDTVKVEARDEEVEESSHALSSLDIKRVKNEGQLNRGGRHSGRSSPVARQSLSTVSKMEAKETIGGDILLKTESGDVPKLSRRATQKVAQRAPPLFTDLPDATPNATSSFEILRDCTYAAKYLGYTEAPLECDCNEEWDSTTKSNHACGEDSDCINRVTKMECCGDCGCGADCQNQRFQRKQYADVSVIKTEKKGYGLRANVDLSPNQFIFEYIGEVIGEPAFRRRMRQYDEEGIKHFYFMSLTKGEFVDATRKGNLGRFCNHSCNPNCYVDKWVVGEKLRMGIFAERFVKAGEELVFNYNVDRYGADPQPCYCGEPNCLGFIGGKTQSGGATKLSSQVAEALGIEDDEDWDTAVAKKPRKRKTGEDDSEYISNVQPKALDQSAVRKVMATLATCKEKWIAIKLLSRIQDSNDEGIRFQVIRMHGYRILNSVLKTFNTDANVCQQVCDILSRFPMLTKNKIHDSGIEATMVKLADETSDIPLKEQAQSLLEKWAKLEMGFRIKKVKRDPNAYIEEEKLKRRDTVQREQPRSRSKSPEVPKGPAAPTGPKISNPRGAAFPRTQNPFRPRPMTLPDGWFQATAVNGSIYYYNALGTTTWQRPTQPALAAPPPPPLKAVSDQEVLQNLINSIITKKEEAQDTNSKDASQSGQEDRQDRKEDRWKSYSEEKRRKIYENTLFPHIAHVMNKYKKHLDKSDLKKFAKQIAKKLVDSDFKKNRVGDPAKKLDSKQEKVVKGYVKDFFDKAVQKQKERRKQEAAVEKPNKSIAEKDERDSSANAANDDIELSENEIEDEEEGLRKVSATPSDTWNGIKRGRDVDDQTGGDFDETKRLRMDQAQIAPPAPPPPPPPASAEEMTVDAEAMQFEMTPITNPESKGHDTESADNIMDMADDPNIQLLREMNDSNYIQTMTPPTTGSPEYEKGA